VREEFYIGKLRRVFVGDDIDEATHLLRIGQIEIVDATLRDRAGDKISISGIWQRHVGGIVGLARYLWDGVIARHGLTHIGLRLGSGSRHGQISIVAACCSARATTRLPSSILNAL